MKFKRYILIVICVFSFVRSEAQLDSAAQSTYFLEQNGLISPKGSLVYNNYFVLASSLTYNINERLKVSAGLLTVPPRPPFYINAQYVIPITNDLTVGGSIGFYQIDYSKERSSYIVVPQLLITKGNRFVNTTLSGGVVRGRFLFGSGFLFPSRVNLPNRVNILLSLSHRRPLVKDFSLITQNIFITAQAPPGSRYSEIVMLSIGGAWQLGKKSAFKFGGVGILYPKSRESVFSTFFPFLGYTLTMK